MGSKLCKDSDRIKAKSRGSKKQYICIKCGKRSPSEKWCCKPKEIMR